jgi:hypothetical protein
MSEQPAALQLRLLQTVVAVAAEKNSTLVLPFPVELLRFLERAQQPAQQPAPPAPQTQQPPAQPQPSLPEAQQRPIQPQELSAQAQQLLAQWQQSMQEQLPPVETPLDPDFGGSKSGQD